MAINLDLPALRKLLADYREWQAGTDPMPHTHDRLSNALVANADTLIRAAEERDALLAAAKEPGLTIADTERHMAALCDETVIDEDAEAAKWERMRNYPLAPDSYVRHGHEVTGAFIVYGGEIDTAVRIMRERGAALKQMEMDRDWERHWWPLRIAKSLSMTEEEMGRTPSMAEMAVLRMRTDLIARAENAEAEVARLQSLVADVAKDMAKAIALMEATK